MFAPAFCLVWVVKRQWDVGRPAPRPPLRLAAMRSLTVCRCRGRRPRRPAKVSCGGRYAGGMIFFPPTGYLLAGVGRKVAEGSRPLPTMQRIKEWQWQGSVNGLRTRGAREGGSPPLPSWRVVDREWAATQGPSESPSPLTRPAPFDKGASLAPCGGSGEHPNFKTEQRARALSANSNTAFA